MAQMDEWPWYNLQIQVHEGRYFPKLPSTTRIVAEATVNNEVSCRAHEEEDEEFTVFGFLCLIVFLSLRLVLECAAPRNTTRRPWYKVATIRPHVGK